MIGAAVDDWAFSPLDKDASALELRFVLKLHYIFCKSEKSYSLFKLEFIITIDL